MSGSNASKRDDGASFLQKLAWTVLFGIVFGAGLITGQRLIENQSAAPLVSVGSEDSESAEGTPAKRSSDNASSQDPVFSFYDRLSGEDAPKEANTAPESPSTSSEGSDSPPGDDRARAPEPSAPPEEQTDETPAKYTLQVSAHSSMEKARAKMRRLQKIGLDPYLVSAKIPDKGTYYRVRVGKFPSMERARRFQNEVERKRGVETFVSPL